ncbi:MAG: thioredoxin family protein [Bacteroidota bacterium]
MNKVDNLPKKNAHPFWRWFWLSFLVASLAYTWYSFYAPSNNVAWSDNMVAAKEIANESNKNMMLFFTGKWCSPCRIMKRNVFADKEVADAINAKFVPIIIDIDDPNSKEIVKGYKVGTTPVTIFTNPDGEVINYAVGKIGKVAFLELLGNAKPL